MTTIIPQRLPEPPSEDKRFYVVTDSAVHLDLQREAHKRGTSLYLLAGAVLTQWLNQGCPSDFGDSYEVLVSQCTGGADCPHSLSPSSSPSREHQGGAA